MNLRILENLRNTLAKSCGLEPSVIPEIAPELCPPNMNGDFAVNCFRLASVLKKKPDVIAENVAQILSSDKDIEAVERVGAFVNARLRAEALHSQVIELSSGAVSSPILPPEKRRCILVEFSSPNTNKPLHLGHLRNNAIGHSISELLKKFGHKIVKVNLVNDRGIHICKSMIAYKLFGDLTDPEKAGVKGDHLAGDFYVKFDSELKKQIAGLRQSDSKLKDTGDDDLFEKTPIGCAAQDMLRKWEAGDRETLDLWKKMNSWALKGFDETYSRMGISFDKIYYESGTYILGKDIVEKGLSQGVFHRREDGAIYADLEKYGLGKKVLLRADGTSVYITQDLGTTTLKHNDFHPDEQIWVVGDEQIHHFKTLFAVLKELGFDWADKLHHLSYGMVNLPSGRMKSREGTVVDADDLFDEMFTLAKTATIERLDGADTPEDLQERAEAIGMGALKFMLLKFNSKTTMTFDPQASLKFEGDTGPYVQYACARINSILRKCSDNNIPYEPDKADFSKLSSKEERELSVRAALYPTVLKQAAEKLDCSIITNYLLDLAKSFSRFYREHSVMKADDESLRNARIRLALLVRDILSDGLSILGIKVPEAM
jgi:arginyl-tRNA synthetase